MQGYTALMMRRGICFTLALVLAAPQGRGEDAEVRLLPKGIDRDTKASIDKALEFLAREQAKDGCWRSGGGYGQYPCAMSALAGLALLASGSTPTRGPYAKNVRRVTRYLLGQQQQNGLIAAPIEEGRSMYGHGFGLLFLSQVYGMEEDVQKQRRIKDACKRAITLIARSQSADGGWLYTPDSGGDEGSVTVTQVQALRGCRNAGIFVPKKTIDNAIRYIERSQSGDGGIRYSVRSSGSRPALTAAACAVLYNAGAYDSKIADRAFKYAWDHCQPMGGRQQGHYFYTQLYMSQACWQKGDQHWDNYFPKIQRRLLTTQQGNGSWNGDHVGLVYGTAIGLLILQIPYNKLPILSR